MIEFLCDENTTLLDFALKACHPSQTQRFKTINEMMSHPLFENEHKTPSLRFMNGLCHIEVAKPLLLIDQLMDIQVTLIAMNRFYKKFNTSMVFNYLSFSLFLRSVSSSLLQYNIQTIGGASIIISRVLYYHDIENKEIEEYFHVPMNQIELCANRITIILKGMLRSYTLFDVTTDLVEQQWGLSCIADPDTAHLNYTSSCVSKKRRFSF